MAIYFDSFTRAASTTSAGTSDSGHTYSYPSAVFGPLGITVVGTEGYLYNPSASAAGMAIWDSGVREFDTTYTLGGTLGSSSTANLVWFGFAGASDLSEYFYVCCATNALFLVRGISGTNQTLKTHTVTITSTSSIRIRATKSRVSCWVDGTFAFSFDITANPSNTNCFWSMPAGSTATVKSPTMSEIGTAAKTSSQLVTRIRSLFGETTAANSNVTPAEMIEFLNQEIEEVNKDYPLLTGDLVVSGAAFDANSEYPLPADCYQIEEVTIGTGANATPLEPMRYIDRRYSTGMFRDVTKERNREGYAIRGNRLVIMQVAATDTYYIRYRRAAGEIDADTSSEIPQAFNNVLVYGALKRCYEKLQDWDSAAYWETQRVKAFASASDRTAQSRGPQRKIMIVC